MSTSRPFIIEIAARLRGSTPSINESSPAAVANALDRNDCPCHQHTESRLPSARPINSRWDKSRAIVLGGSKRPVLRDLTWTASDGIIFASSQRPIPNVAQRYASRAASRGVPSTPGVWDDGFGGSELSTASSATIRDLLAKIAELEADIERLKKQTPQVQLDQQKQQYEALLHNEKSVAEELLKKERERLEALQSDLENQRRDHDELNQKHEALESARSGLQSRLDARLREHLETDRLLTAERDAHQSVQERFDELQKEFDSLKSKHEEYKMAAPEHESHLTLLQKYQDTGWAAAIKEMEPKMATLKASLQSEKDTVERMSKELDQARQDISTLETQRSSLQGQIESRDKSARELHAEVSQHIDSLRAKQKSLEDELSSRVERRRNMPDYDSYREVWRRDLGTYLNAFDISRKTLVREQTKYWHAAQNRWLAANHLLPCLQQYPKVRDLIQDFLTLKLTLAREHGEDLQNVMLEFRQAEGEQGKVGHDSRILTKHVHFEEYPELGGIARVVYDQQLARHINLERFQLNERLKEMDPTSKNKLLNETKFKLKQAARIQHAVTRKRVLQSIQRAGPVDQGIFVRFATADAIRAKMFMIAYEDALPWELVYRQREWLRDLSQLKALVFERFSLEEKMGKLSLAEQKRNMKFIEEQLEAADENLIEVCTKPSSLWAARPTVTPATSVTIPSNKARQRVASPTAGRKRPQPQKQPKKRADIKVGNLRPTAPLQAHHQSFPVQQARYFAMGSQTQKLGYGSKECAARHLATEANPAQERLEVSSNLRHEATPTKSDSGMLVSEAQSDSGHEDVVFAVQSEQCHSSDPLSDEAVEACVEFVGSPTTTYWSHTQYQNSEGKPPAVYYCTSLETSERQAKLFLDDPVVGFDIEWEAFASPKTHGLKQNVSLIQLASRDKIGLFHVACFKGRDPEELMPPSLRTILESKNITKAGVNVVGDRNRIRQCFGIEMKGLLELSHLYRVVHFSNTDQSQVNFKLVSLATQVATMFSLPLRKDETRVSRWSSKLSNQQTAYAATDAYAGFRLFHELEKLRLEMDPQPPRPAHFETLAPLVLGDGTQIARNTRRSTTASKSKLTSAGETVIEEDDESEEFFDAMEHVDDESSNFNVVEADAAHMLYPDLKKLSLVHDLKPQAEAPPIEADASFPPNFKHADDLNAGSSGQTPLSIPLGAETRQADAWAQSFLAGPPASNENLAGRAASSRRTVNVSSLRAYHLWHEQRFDLREVASFCRQPPLALTTVASYIMTAIKEEDLPFDKDRARKVLAALPFAVKNLYARTIEARC